MPLGTFEEKIDSITGDIKPSILLGNGFSQACRNDIFNYQNLFQQANFGARDANIRGIFDSFDTYDFEKIMRTLESAQTICTAYNLSIIDQISVDLEQLKNSLIQVISQTHPTRSSSITAEQYEKAKPFILRFDSIFTLNYDLLLYWIVNKNEILPQGYHTDDGFRHNIWKNSEEQNLFFLHGGLHLYDEGSCIKKHIFNGNIDTSIVDSVQQNLDEGNFPLFVSEPSHQKKLIRIKHNPYLNHCFKSLKKLNGKLFIHGHSMDENDRHIFDQIKMSNIDQIFISIFGNEDSEQNRNTIANAHRFLKTPRNQIDFYDAATAAIWN